METVASRGGIRMMTLRSDFMSYLYPIKLLTVPPTQPARILR